MGTDPLADLRDIELPDPIHWWPPVPGWWLLLVLFLLVFTGLLLISWWWRNRLRRAALKELRDIYHEYTNTGDLLTLIQQTNILLRRYLSASGAKQAARLTGKDWLTYLDARCNAKLISNSEATVLAEGPYQPTPKVDGERFVGVIERWLKESRKIPKS
jgi:Domain of unknown function (DUF4381)